MTLQRAVHPFHFVTRMNLIELTGLKAKSLEELVDILKSLPTAATYHHTHHFLKQHHFLSPEPPNDFAYWVTSVLKEDRLGEQLAAIDTVQFTSLRALRDRIAQVIGHHLAGATATRIAPPGEEFYVMKSLSFVLPTPHQAADLFEFSEAIQKVSVQSLYHHIFESRLRLERGANDFSNWLDKELGEKILAQAIARLDPYTQTLDSLRKRILHLINVRLSQLTREATHA